MLSLSSLHLSLHILWCQFTGCNFMQGVFMGLCIFLSSNRSIITAASQHKVDLRVWQKRFHPLDAFHPWRSSCDWHASQGPPPTCGSSFPCKLVARAIFPGCSGNLSHHRLSNFYPGHHCLGHICPGHSLWLLGSSSEDWLGGWESSSEKKEGSWRNPCMPVSRSNDLRFERLMVRSHNSHLPKTSFSCKHLALLLFKVHS